MKNILISLVVLYSTATFGQKISQSKVPSVIVDNFQTSFPDASDIEWKQDGNTYKVEFELGVFMQGNDHDVWYDLTGTIVKHKEEISKSELPKKVLTKIKSDFDGYRIDDLEKITEKKAVIYKVQLEKNKTEWEVSLDENGNVLNKREG